ncbi:MAG: ABC transporter ATP-binding protein [Thermoplasmata archaeon]
MPDETVPEPLLAVRALDAAWGSVPVLRSISFDLAPGELVSLLGPNGSGKTTLLRCLAGLETPRGGSIRLRGTELVGRPPHRRGVGMVSQDPSLFPHRTVWENVAYGPQVQRWSGERVEARVAELLGQFSLVGFSERYPGSLSGGEQQRVALARALAPRPELLLLDEPFASVDPELRAGLRAEFRELLHAQGTTVIHVTHDREEGFFLGDRVLLLFEGRVAQSGTPQAIWDRPADRTVAAFLGYNILLRDGRAVGVRPDRLRIGPGTGPGVPAQVIRSGFVGEFGSVLLRLDDGGRAEVRCAPTEPLLPPGLSVRLSWDVEVPIGTVPHAEP